MTNPYTSRSGLKHPATFRGRLDELREIAGFIGKDESVAVIGPRKIGKTSLLLHLMRPATRASLQLGSDSLLVYINCQALGSARRPEIYAYFCTEIATTLQESGLEAEPALRTTITSPTHTAFEGAVRRLNKRGLQLVLMLDEFDQLALNPEVDIALYNGLRSISGPPGRALITAAARPLLELTYSGREEETKSSPFFNLFAPLFLGLFPEEEARSLIHGPMEAVGRSAAPELEDFIYDLVGGHPLALQIACYHAWNNPDNLQLVEHRTVAELDAHFQYYWDNLSATEREVLRQPQEAGLREPGDPALRATVRDLVQKCLLLRSEGSYRYPSRAWAEFVAAQRPDSTDDPPVEKPVQITQISNPHLQEDEPPEVGRLPIVVPTTVEGNKRSLMDLLWNSIPEMIGGLAVLIVGAIIFQREQLQPWFYGLIDDTNDFLLGHRPAVWALSVIALFILAVASISLVLRRRRERKQGAGK